MRDQDARITYKVDAVPTGSDKIEVIHDLRTNTGGLDRYAVVAGIYATGEIRIRVDSYNGGTWHGSTIAEVTNVLTGVTAGEWLKFRAQANGIGGATVVRAKVWRVDEPEPASWDLSGTPSSPSDLAGGYGALQFTSIASQVVTLDNLNVGEIGINDEQVVSNPALLGGATTFAPEVQQAAGSQTVSDPALQGGATLFSPSVAQKVAAVLLGAAAIFSPVITTQTTVSDPALQGGAQVFAPTVQPGPVSVSDPALQGGAQVFAPTVTTQTTVSDPALLGGAVTFQPTVTTGPVTVSDPALLGGAVLFDPTLSQGGGAQSVSDPALQGGAQTFDPTVQPGPVSVSDPALLGGAATFAPTITTGGVTVSDPALQGGAQTFAPTITTGNVTVSDPALLGGAQTFAPTITVGNFTISDPALQGGAVIYGPTVSQAGGTQFVSNPALLGPAITFGPTLQPGAVSVSDPRPVGSCGHLRSDRAARAERLRSGPPWRSAGLRSRHHHRAGHAQRSGASGWSRPVRSEYPATGPDRR